MNEENIKTTVIPAMQETAVLPTENGTEIDNTDSIENVEDMPESTELETGTVEQGDATEYLSQIAGDVHILMLIVLLTFCWNAMRSFRKHTLKGGV